MKPATTPPLPHWPHWPHGAWLGLRRLVLAWWFGLPAPLQSRTWPTALACLTILALLLGFHQVVASAVRQGELLRMTAATQSEALWRCRALSNAATRASCLRQLDASRAESQVAKGPPPNTARLAQLGP
jgi:hypothetical protein